MLWALLWVLWRKSFLSWDRAAAIRTLFSLLCRLCGGTTARFVDSKAVQTPQGNVYSEEPSSRASARDVSVRDRVPSAVSTVGGEFVSACAKCFTCDVDAWGFFFLPNVCVQQS